MVVTDVHEGRVAKVTAELASAAPDGVRVIGKVLDVRVFSDIDVVARRC